MTDERDSGTGKTGFFGKLTCKHNWVKRENWYQPDRSTGKVAYKCSECGKVVKKPASRV